jgi:microcystin-dependent protein
MSSYGQLGQIAIFAFPFAPPGWMACAGQELSIEENARYLPLFTRIGTTYGGVTDTQAPNYGHFALPTVPPLTPVGPHYCICIEGGSHDPLDVAASFLGQIRFFPTNAAAPQWAPCDGRHMAVALNTALFSLFGPTYGGDEVHAFALPKLPPPAPAGPFPYICIKGAYPPRW